MLSSLTALALTLAALASPPPPTRLPPQPALVHLWDIKAGSVAPAAIDVSPQRIRTRRLPSPDRPWRTGRTLQYGGTDRLRAGWNFITPQGAAILVRSAPPTLYDPDPFIVQPVVGRDISQAGNVRLESVLANEVGGYAYAWWIPTSFHPHQGVHGERVVGLRRADGSLWQCVVPQGPSAVATLDGTIVLTTRHRGELRCTLFGPQGNVLSTARTQKRRTFRITTTGVQTLPLLESVGAYGRDVWAIKHRLGHASAVRLGPRGIIEVRAPLGFGRPDTTFVHAQGAIVVLRNRSSTKWVYALDREGGVRFDRALLPSTKLVVGREGRLLLVEADGLRLLTADGQIAWTFPCKHIVGRPAIYPNGELCFVEAADRDQLTCLLPNEG